MIALTHRKPAAVVCAFVLAIAGFGINPSAAAPKDIYEVVASYAVGGTGGWDFISVDEKRHRVYVSRGDRVQVVDSLSGKVVGELPGTAGVHGIAVADDLGVGFTS